MLDGWLVRQLYTVPSVSGCGAGGGKLDKDTSPLQFRPMSDEMSKAVTPGQVVYGAGVASRRRSHYTMIRFGSAVRRRIADRVNIFPNGRVGPSFGTVTATPLLMPCFPKIPSSLSKISASP